MVERAVGMGCVLGKFIAIKFELTGENRLYFLIENYFVGICRLCV